MKTGDCGDNCKVAVNVAELKARLDAQEDWLRSTAEKLDLLLEAAHMGKGAWAAMLRMGGLLVVALAGLAWIGDHLPKWIK